MENICKNCKFYQGSYCHRFPKPVHKLPTDFCGEFKASNENMLYDSEYNSNEDISNMLLDTEYNNYNEGNMNARRLL